MVENSNYYETPLKLEEICLDVVSSNIMSFIKPQSQPDVGDNTITSNNEIDCYTDERRDKRFIFKNAELFLPRYTAEKLFKYITMKKLLSDAILNIFGSDNAPLKKIQIQNANITKQGLQILKKHKITHLEITDLDNISFSDVLDCFDDTLENLVVINLSRCSAIDTVCYNLNEKISNLKSLTDLNLSYCYMDNQLFKVICSNIKTLKSLNISGTDVRDIRPVTSLAKQLQSFSIADLNELTPGYNPDYFIPTIEQLTELKHFDISLVQQKAAAWGHFNPHMSAARQLMIAENILPKLVSLDVSGWGAHISTSDFLNFIRSHPNLKFTGIVLTDLDREFKIQPSPLLAPLSVAAINNEKGIIVSLKIYKDRAFYMQKALYNLFQFSGSFTTSRPDLLELILPVMAAHPNHFPVQMAATACLYNLTRSNLSKNIHPHLLSKCINLTLDAMEKFPDEFQLQKNSLLTLCSDRVLQEVTFQRYKCAKLVLDALCGFEDFNMNRMAVAICSILASKVTREENAKLGSSPVYMHKLLGIIQHRIDHAIDDITLKFTLSALWNLTDESPPTCGAFLEYNGANLYLSVLNVYRGRRPIQAKILGLLNNIAEVANLRHYLINVPLLNELHELLKSGSIDVSYFAAGIVAHLGSDGEDAWGRCRNKRPIMLQAIMDAMSRWETPECEMVAYRSFKPFFPLLNVDKDYRVQRWALWAMHHVCSKNSRKYCPMLYDNDGHKLLSNLINYDDTNEEIKQMALQILELLGKNGVNLVALDCKYIMKESCQINEGPLMLINP